MENKNKSGLKERMEDFGFKVIRAKEPPTKEKSQEEKK
jgi:hypothetical protein